MKRILLVSHTSGLPGGPPDKFYAYLKQRYSVSRVIHPLFPTTNQKSTILFGNKSLEFKIPALLQYPLEGLYTLFYWHKNIKSSKIDLAICFDSLAFLHIYFCKRFLRVDKIVFYNVDYSTKRFPNIFLNAIYQNITKFSYICCDYFFSFSNMFIEDMDPLRKYTYKNFTLKTTIDFSIKKGIKKISNSIIYAGILDYGSINFDPFLHALKRLKEEKIPFSFHIYGKTDPESKIQKKIKKLHLQDNIVFKGTTDNQTLTQKILPCYSLGVAPYATIWDDSFPDYLFMNKDLTGKLVDYIGAGLPIVSTRINGAFRMIDDNKIGFSVISSKDWYQAIRSLLVDKALHKKFSKNAYAFASGYDTDTLLRPIFKEILGNKRGAEVTEISN